MLKGNFKVPVPVNETVKSYSPNSQERESLLVTYRNYFNQKIEIPMTIGGKKIRTNNVLNLTPPHDHKHVIGNYHRGKKEHVKQAIQAALDAKEKWEKISWEQRAAIFLKAAELIADFYRDRINAATMLAQSKNVYQSEIDAACEFIDFLRYNVYFMQQIYNDQPISTSDVWNRVEYRPLEGFVFAVTPFNFTAIAGNLPAAPALMGNTVVWKPADSQIYSAGIIMEIFEKAGLPDGVINLIFTDGPETGDIVFKHPEFSGLHFTGSTQVFKNMWKTIGENINIYKTYPRIVGETGGKDFIIAHKSANTDEVVTALIRGAFEFQGQKCSAASRAYLPKNKWNKIKEKLIAEVATIKMGSPEDTSNFMTAVIDERSFDKISRYIEYIKNSNEAKIIIGGGYDKSKGYFVEPTIAVADKPDFKTMCEEIFGPVLTIYVYDENKFEEILHTIDETSSYALTGAILSKDRYAIELATNLLRNSAGNFYINDKPTGAVVGQQPFGGARDSGTNDKAGSYLNLLRWVSARTIKENLRPQTNYRYPFLG